MMWKKPWNMKEGFLIGGGLLLVGLLLQLVAGPIDWSLLARPVNLILLILFLAVVGGMYALRNKVYAFEWMMHAGAAVPCLTYAAALTILMGLFPQLHSGGVPWLSRMLHFWPFVLIWAWLVVISALAALNHLLRWKLREIPFILNHAGVALAVTAATLGNADVQTLQMTVFAGQAGWRALDEAGMTVEAGVGIELHRFIMEEYPDHTPRRFASDVTLHTKEGKRVTGTVEVNRPMKADGWKIYQYGYDVTRGPESDYSEFLLVRDPWLPWVYAGIFMMLAGALCLMLLMAPKPLKP